MLLVDETGVPGKNHRPVASYWQNGELAIKFKEYGSGKNTFESWPTKDHFSSNFWEDFDIFFLNNIPNRYLKCREKGRYVELLNAMLLQLKFDLILTYDKAADAIYMLSLAAILNWDRAMCLYVNRKLLLRH
jgi:hypothetical protein